MTAEHAIGMAMLHVRIALEAEAVAPVELRAALKPLEEAREKERKVGGVRERRLTGYEENNFKPVVYRHD